MSKINLYIIREISLSFLFLVILLTGIVWLGQGLRHIDLLTTDNISFYSYLSYVIHLLPKIMSITIPISLFLAVLIIINRIRSDSELIILWSSGESNKNILVTPIIIITSALFSISLFLTFFATPYTLNEIRQMIIEIRSSGISASLLKERKFISPTDTLTIFIQDREGDKIQNLLIHDLKDSNKPQTYIAQSGEFYEDGNTKMLRLFNGNIQIFNKSDERISEIDFQTYDLDLLPYNKQESKHRYADELFTFEIIRNLNGKNISSFNYEEKQQFAELHNRLISPLYLFCLSILPLVAFNFQKTPNASWHIPIIFVSILALVIKIVEISFSNLLIETNNLVYLNYALPIILFIILFIVIVAENNKLGRKKDVF